MTIVKINKKDFVILEESKISVGDFVCEYLPTGNGKVYIGYYQVADIEIVSDGYELYLASDGNGSNCVEKIVKSTINLGANDHIQLTELFKLITKTGVKVYKLTSVGKFRLPRKIKKKLNKDYWFYPLNVEEQTYQVAYPQENEIDYMAWKLGILEGQLARLRMMHNKSIKIKKMILKNL